MVKDETIQLVVISLVLMTTIIGGIYVTSMIRHDDPIQDRHILKYGDKLPTLWIYLNDSEVNSRRWTGFEERSSRVINIPFLNLCYETCVKMNGKDYRIEVIGGLSDLAVRLGGWEQLPSPLQNPQDSLHRSRRGSRQNSRQEGPLHSHLLSPQGNRAGSHPHSLR